MQGQEGVPVGISRWNGIVLQPVSIDVLVEIILRVHGKVHIVATEALIATTFSGFAFLTEFGEKVAGGGGPGIATARALRSMRSRCHGKKVMRLETEIPTWVNTQGDKEWRVVVSADVSADVCVLCLSLYLSSSSFFFLRHRRTQHLLPNGLCAARSFCDAVIL